MADVPNLKINERSNVERPNSWVIEIENKNWESLFISKSIYENWKKFEKCGISKGRTIRKLTIFGTKFWFSQLKNFRNLLIFHFGKFKKLLIWNISKTSN